jgi:hypothetical protein
VNFMERIARLEAEVFEKKPDQPAPTLLLPIDVDTKAALLLRKVFEYYGLRFHAITKAQLQAQVIRWAIANNLDRNLRETLRKRLGQDDFLRKEVGWSFDGTWIELKERGE